MSVKHETRTYSAPLDKSWEAITQACSKLNWTVQSSDQKQGVLETKSGVSVLCPFGVAMSIRLTELEPGKTAISIESKSRGQVIDYGQSRREINRLLETMESFLYAAPAIQSGGAFYAGNPCAKCGTALNPQAKFCGACGEPAPTGGVEQPANICRNCGATYAENAKFCSNCGTPVK
ncbi:MAG: zinc ribbon domain-containing protein [Peptococcaceae bacterium]|jgi:ribosomal protein L37E|nr:zinc ribbon domain-containing protein [Peptococcaceae bacterium]MDH7524690.1 zinc ribbon domain-containing protein [Peptococcaceae bacterium]